MQLGVEWDGQTPGRLGEIHTMMAKTPASAPNRQEVAQWEVESAAARVIPQMSTLTPDRGAWDTQRAESSASGVQPATANC
jgi:hypothetical protein